MGADGATKGAAKGAAADGGAAKSFTLAECEKHTTHNDCWLILHEKVYNVTEYLDEHPGGGEVMLSSAGKDATMDFEDVGHSSHARSMLAKYQIGTFAGGESARPARKAVTADGSSSYGAGMTKLLQLLLPLLVILLAVAAFSLQPSAAAGAK